VQHEVDHLNGKLYIDRLSSLKRERLLKKLKEAASEA
jgi:peptide deformylase